MLDVIEETIRLKVKYYFFERDVCLLASNSQPIKDQALMILLTVE
jgi:hypothetical protein